MAQCVKNISTDPANPVSNEFLPLYGQYHGINYTINPFLNGFDWQAPQPHVNIDLWANWNIGFTNPTNNQYLEMMWPFADQMPLEFSYLYQDIGIYDRDMHWEDGWELLWLNLGYFPNLDPIYDPPPGSPYYNTGFQPAPNHIPYFALYNRYTGLLRMVSNVWHDAFGQRFQDLNIKLYYGNQFNWLNQLSGLLRHADKLDRPLDQKTNVTSIFSPKYHPPLNHQWMVAEFQLGYDPCICHSSGKLQFDFTTFNQMNITGFMREIALEKNITDLNYKEEDILNLSGIDPNEYKGGTLIYKSMDRMIDDYIEASHKYDQDYQDYMKHKNSFGRVVMGLVKEIVVNGVTELIPTKEFSFLIKKTQIGKVKLDTSKVEGLNKSIINGSKGIVGFGYDLLSTSIFGPDPEMPRRPSTPVATLSESSFIGTITEEHSTYTEPLFIPGSVPGGFVGPVTFSPSSFPAYNEVPGLFALLSTPKVSLFQSTVNSEIEFNPPAGGWDKELTNHKKVVLKFNEPLKYKLNPVLDYDMSKTGIYVAFKVYLRGAGGTSWLSGNIGNNPAPLIERNADNAFSNMEMWHHIIQNGSERITMFSKFIPIENAGLELYGFDLESTVLSDFNIYDGEVLFDAIPSDLNLFVEKIEMKIFADYFFNQVGWNGEELNTMQVFTYPIYDYENEGYFEQYGQEIFNESQIVLFNPGTLKLSGTYGPGSPEITEHNGFDLYIRSRDVLIIGDLFAQPGYNLYIEAVNSIKQLPSTNVSPFVTKRIKDFLDVGSMPMMTDDEVRNYCTDNSGEYKANQPATQPNQDVDINKEEYPEIPEKRDNLNLFTSPNPAQNKFTVRIQEDDLKKYTFQIINMSGTILIQEQVSGAGFPVFEFDVSKIPSGIYILITTDDSGNVSKKKISIVK